jgi:hypothetical protein
MHVYSRVTQLGLAIAVATFAACSDSTTDPVTVIPPGDADITTDITANRTLHAETTYTIKGFIHVANGATLTIEAGTTILGEAVDNSFLGSSLFILRGSRIIAIGTEASPIVFTSSKPSGQRQPGDWGGLIIVGNGIINRSVATGLIVEGTGTLAAGTADSLGKNYRVTYDQPAGSTGSNTDNSGELRYVRVEFAGFAPADANELNSFTFAAVGSGTRLSYLQALAGLDDSFEFFGGAVDADHLVSYESGDDHFDMSEGYVGRLQFLIGLQTTQIPPRSGAIGVASTDPQGIENDGCNGAGCAADTHNSTPLTIPLVANFTLIGTGSLASSSTGGGFGMVLRRGTGGYYVNGVLARWPRAGISVRDAATYLRAENTATPSMTTTDLSINNVVLLETATMFEAGTARFSFDGAANALTSPAPTLSAAVTAFPATVTAATLTSAFDWAPAAASPIAAGGLATFSGKLATKATGVSSTGHAFTGTAFVGAAAPGGAKWWQNWTRYAQN